MNRGLTISLLILYCWCSLSGIAQTSANQQAAQRAYQQGINLFNARNPTSRTDSLALQNFRRVIALISPNRTTATMFLRSCLHAGIITQTNNQQAQALTYYQRAIRVGRSFSLVDSLLFKPYLYAGAANYYLYAIDSATYYYKEAEKIYLKYPQISDNQRIYNSFGALYYEAGDFRQSINYFQKALQLHQKRSTERNDVFTRYTSNIASARRRLGQYDSAAALYRQLLPLGFEHNRILINLGATYIEKKAPDEAIRYLLQVKNAESNNLVMYENTLAKAYTQQKRFSEATDHLNNALAIYRKQQRINKTIRKNTEAGVTYKLLGDVACQQKRYLEALQFYQQSIIQLDYKFNQASIERNPQQFTESFSGYLLFESLAAKASCLQKQLMRQRKGVTMQMAIDAYRSALALANHIQKSLDTEESRLFIVQNVFPVHQQAVSLLIWMYKQTNDQKFLEEAFQRSEQSKAAVLYIGRKENESKVHTGIPDSLLNQERNLRFSLSQLYVAVDQATTNEAVNSLQSTIRDKELALSRLANRLLEYPDYYRKKFGADTIDLVFLRERVLSKKTALISFFETEPVTFAFVLTRKGLTYHAIPNDPMLQQTINQVVSKLRMVGAGENYGANRQAQYLYRQLIKPIEPAFNDCTSLIIIPHNDLTQLSFEALEDEQQRYLLERFDVTYQYSVSFLRPEPNPHLIKEQVLAVAPFNGPGITGPLGRLPASEEEVNRLQGTRLVRQEATKNRFLQLAQKASVIHLATHAIANDKEPSRSYIAFYPQANHDDKLYAHELQYGFLAQVSLIFLSACETASGQLIRGEGVMSLSRALSYAGCSNLITSLWKAEDHATAYISRQFYEHLDEGNSVARSLQLAKLDLIQNSQYAQFHSPQYWSHLVFVGSPSENSENFSTVAMVATGSLILLFSGWYWWRIRQKKVAVILQ